MKKFISLITLIALLITALAIFASCGAPVSKEIEYGKDDKISWSYDPTTKILTVKGDDSAPTEMNAYTRSGETLAPWHKYRTTASTIIISGVSKISANAFYSMYAITDVKFLDSHITEIGDFAFAFCSSLASVTLPANLTTIGTSAFEACAKLKDVKIPAKVTTIGERAFALNNSLATVSMPDAYSIAMSQEQFDSIFFGIPQPALTRYELDESGAEVQAPTESTAPSESDTTTESSKETSAPADKDSTEKEPQSNLTTIIAVLVFAVVIIGIIVGIVLVMRSNNKQTKDSQTVRKNDNTKNSQSNKKSSYNKNGKSKGKKK